MHRAVVNIPRHAADLGAATGDAAGNVAVFHRAARINLSRHAADRVRSGDAGGAVAVLHCTVSTARYTADIILAGNAAGDIAVLHRAENNRSRHAADNGAVDAAGDRAVFHRAGHNFPRHAADIAVTGDACALDAEIFYCSIDNNSEQTLIVVVGAVNRQPGDFLVVAVKGSIE